MNKLAIVIGNILSAFGVCASLETLNKLDLIFSIVLSVLGFFLSVILPASIKLYNKIKKAKEDGVITDEEIDDICKDAKDIVDDINDKVKGDK